MSDTLDFYVSYISQGLDYGEPVISHNQAIDAYGNQAHYPYSKSLRKLGMPAPILGTTPPEDKKEWLTSVSDFTHRDYNIAFTRAPIHSSAIGYIVSDRVAEVLKSFNLGRSCLEWVPPTQKDNSKYRGVWTLWIGEKFPTLIMPPKIIHPTTEEDRISSLDYAPARLKVSGGTFSMVWRNDVDPPWALPCRRPETDIDIWRDPFWLSSLFLSERLVDALREHDLIEGKKDGWRLFNCREARVEEYEADQVQPWLRAITDNAWQAMTTEDFEILRKRALEEFKATMKK